MQKISEQEDIKLCTRLIEEKLDWGVGANWTNQDFEKLSDRILHQTGVILSITTLKRLWGRLKYNSQPSQTTLNALANYLGYDDWRDFVQTNKKENIAKLETTQKKISQKHSVLWSIGIGIILLISALAFMPKSEENSFSDIITNLNISNIRYSPDDFSFEADKIVTEGVPNSVVFTYDASAAKTDSIFIVQSWDISRKTLVSKERNHHSAIYYWPGFFRSKLIVDDQIVKTHDIQITSDGWLALAEQQEVPIYFTKSEIQQNEAVLVDESILEKNGISLLPNSPRIRFFNQGDFGSLRNDNFTFQTTIKNSHYRGDNACQFVEILVQCKDDVIIIPLSDKTCVGDLRLYAAGHTLLSTDSDLSGFGADLTEWTTLRIETIDQEMKVFVEGKKSAEFNLPHTPTGIVGLQYRFYGTGAINEAWFENKNDRWDLMEEEKTITAKL